MANYNQRTIPEADLVKDFDREYNALRAQVREAHGIILKLLDHPRSSELKAQLFSLGKPLVGQKGLIDLLPIEERALYTSIEVKIRKIEDDREKELSVLEWIVFPGDHGSTPWPHHTWQGIQAGWHAVGLEPMDTVEFYHAASSAHSILYENAGLYTDEERRKVQALCDQVRDYLSTRDGIVLDTRINAVNDYYIDIAVKPHDLPARSHNPRNVQHCKFPEFMQLGKRVLPSTYGRTLFRTTDDPEYISSCIATLTGVSERMVFHHVPERLTRNPNDTYRILIQRVPVSEPFFPHPDEPCTLIQPVRMDVRAREPPVNVLRRDLPLPNLGSLSVETEVYRQHYANKR
ncbi:hypothetical protein HYS47_05455 [Candidatus Woesearchaeota archaeon]|nr:hypothetical protein [Candidatus Woesearchaeota archaeon]